MRNETIVVTRRQVGQWASYIAGLALMAAVFGWLWQGALTTPVIVVLAVGFISILLWALVAPADFLNFLRGRQIRYGTIAFFSTLLLTGIVAMTYILLQRATLTLDMTADQRFTLSRESMEILEGTRPKSKHSSITCGSK